MPTKAEVLKQLERIPWDEPLFLLRAQDLTSSVAVDDWARRAEGVGATAGKVAGAFDCRDQMILWQRENPGRVKVPD